MSKQHDTPAAPPAWQLYGAVGIADQDILTDFTAFTKGHFLMRYGREIQAVATLTLALPVATGGRPGLTLQKMREQVLARLQRVREEYLAGRPLADQREIRARLFDIVRQRQQAEHEAQSQREEAIEAVKDGRCPREHEQAALAADERVRTLRQAEAELPDEADQVGHNAHRCLRADLEAERDAMLAEALERTDKARQAVAAALAPLLVEAWIAQELANLLRRRTEAQVMSGGADTIDTLIRKLAVIGRYDGRPPKTTAEWNVPHRDGLPPGATMAGSGGAGLSPETIGAAMGSHAKPPQPSENVRV
jgi:hypothetical protein